mgnify:CR=1 FL=1
MFVLLKLMARNVLPLLFVTNFVLILGFSLIFPLLPFYAKQFGASPFQISLLFAAYPLMQFLLSPLWGKLADRFGRRPIILFSLASSALSFLLFGIAQNLFQLYLIRIFHGLGSAAGLPSVYAAGADISTHKMRAQTMGILGSAFSLAIILGPALGGTLSAVSIQFPFFISSIVAVLNFFFVLAMVPETLTKKKERFKISETLAFLKVFQAAKSPLSSVFFVSFISFFSFAIVGVAYPLLALEKFGAGPTQVGSVFVILGLVGAITQGLIVGRAAEKFGEKKVIRVGLLSMMTALFAVPFAPNQILSALVLSGMSFGTSLINPSTNSYVSKHATTGQGLALGVLNSYGSLSRFFGPIFVGVVYQVHGPVVTFWVTAVVAFLGVFLSTRIKG